MTFAVMARCKQTGEFGLAYTTYTLAGGGLSTYKHVPMFGVCLGISTVGRCQRVGATMIADDLGADAAMAAMIDSDPHVASRQLAVVDRRGNVAGYTGAANFAYAGHLLGDSFIVLGNVLTSPRTVETMKEVYQASESLSFARRLIATLEGGRDAGGQLGGQRSSAIVVWGERETPLLDLRVDAHEEPVGDLLRIYEMFEPLVPYYEMHRTNPTGLPRADDWLAAQGAGN